MQRLKIWRAAVLAAPLLFVVACATSPIELGNIWKDPSYSADGFSNILVIGLAPKANTSAILEQVLKEELADKGVQSVAGNQILPASGELDENTVREAVKNSSIDAVLITRVLKVEKGREIVPGASYSMPGTYYSTYWGYYRTSYTMMREPDYIIETTTVTLETNLYDAASEKIVWTAQSRTYTPENVVANINSLSQQVTRDLSHRGLLKKAD